MSIEEYLSQPIEKRFQKATETVNNSDSFWLGALKLAIKTKHPLNILFDKRLVAEYWDLISFKNK